MASTYPLEIVEAARWSKEHPDVKGDAVAGAVQSQTWDPSVKSLVAFPTVLEKMNEKIDWTQKLGDAFLAQQKEVMQAVQVLRNKAKETGNLKSTKEVTVKEEPAPAGSPAPQTIIIESPDPEVVYVPTYNPTVVYGAWAYPYYPPYAYYPPAYYAYGATFWSFTAGVIVGGAIWGNCNWGGNDVDIDINRQNNFNRNEINDNRNSNNTQSHGDRAGNTRRAIAPATTSRAGTHNSDASQGCRLQGFGHAAEVRQGRQPAERRGARAVSRPCRTGPPADVARRARQSARHGGQQRRLARHGRRVDAGSGRRYARRWAAAVATRGDTSGASPATWAAEVETAPRLRRLVSRDRRVGSRSSSSRSSGAFGGGGGGASARSSSSRGGMSRGGAAAADGGDEPGALRICVQQYCWY